MFSYAVGVILDHAFFYKFVDSLLRLLVECDNKMLSLPIHFLLNSNLLKLFDEFSLGIYVLVFFKIIVILNFKIPSVDSFVASDKLLELSPNLSFTNRALACRLKFLRFFIILVVFH